MSTVSLNPAHRFPEPYRGGAARIRILERGCVADQPQQRRKFTGRSDVFGGLLSRACCDWLSAQSRSRALFCEAAVQRGQELALKFAPECGTCPVRLNQTSPAEITTKLCTACTLCCNGTLFADVRLQRGDDARRLEELGVPLSSAVNPRFRQPCSCLQEGVCRIYEDRPNRCRTFECRLLQKTLAGEVTTVAARRTIRAAKKRVEVVRRVLRELGDTDESVPLSRRYQRMMRRPIDLAADDGLAHRRGKLMKAVADLASVLERHFVG